MVGINAAAPLLWTSPFRAAAAEGVNRSCAGDNLAAVVETLGDEILLSGRDGYAPVTEDQDVAALDDQHVFVVVVRMGSGNGDRKSVV